MTEGGRDKETADVCLHVCPSDCHLPLFGCSSVDGSDVGSGWGWEEGG